MKFEIGFIVNSYNNKDLAVNFPGIGVVRASKEGKDGFDIIELNKNDLKKLKKQIDKEIYNGKENNME